MRAKKGVGTDYWRDIIRKLTITQPGRWMTEAPEDDIGSVSKILGALCSFPEETKQSGLFDEANKEQLSEVAVSLLAETSSRGARAIIRSQIEKGKRENPDDPIPTTTDVAHGILLDGLGIDLATCEHPDPDLHVNDKPATHTSEFNLKRATAKSNRFFHVQKTLLQNNCPPQSVLAALSFAENFMNPQFSNFDEVMRGGKKSEIDEMCQIVLRQFNDLSMGKFIGKYINTEGCVCEPVKLQIAMYAQGLKYHNSITRRVGIPSLRQTDKVLNDLVKSVRAYQYDIELGKKLQAKSRMHGLHKTEMRNAEKARKQALFLEQHRGTPRIFGHAEVAEMNRGKSLLDQYVLLPTGLLKDHCCYESCDLYLQDLSTERDKAKDRRGGLYRHLKYYFIPARAAYFSSMHVAAVHIAKRDRTISQDAFIERISKDLSIPRTERNVATICAVYHDVTVKYKDKI